jgi:hypothetical protein
MRLRLLVPGLALTAVGCLRPATQQDLYIAQSLIDIQDTMNEMRQATYEMQDRLDSLKFVVARQDTVIRQLANLAGVPVPP